MNKSPFPGLISKASALLIVLIGLLCYANSLGNAFVWDDLPLVKNNVFLHSWLSAPRLFTQQIFAGSGQESGFYRPLQMLTYRIDYLFWQDNVVGYHLTNTALHILAALALFRLVGMLFGDRRLALVTALLFVAHPLHTEAVTYISGRADPLALLFMLTCFIFYSKYLQAGRFADLALGLLSYAAALLSKEISLILPFLFMVYHIAFRKKVNVRIFLPLTALAGIYLALRMTLLGAVLTNAEPFPRALSGRFFGFLFSVVQYARLLFFPFNLHMEYGYVTPRPFDPQVIAGALILGAMGFCAMRFRKTRPFVFFSLCWFFVSLLPVSNLYPMNASLAEHWLYLPSVGIFMILASLLTSRQAKGPGAPATVITIALLAFFCFLTVRQNHYWKEPAAFYERTLSYSPWSLKAFNNLGNVYARQEKKEEAVAVYKKILEIDPAYAEAHLNLGHLYRDLGEKEEALRSYREALADRPAWAQVHNALGAVYHDLGRDEEAAASYGEALRLNPGLIETYYNLGNAYMALDRKTEAIASFKKSLELFPAYADAYNNIGFIYNSMARYQDALPFLLRAVELKPDYAKAYNNLGVTYGSVGRLPEAIAAYKKAIECDRSQSGAYINLIVAYIMAEKYDQAIRYCDEARRLGFNVSPQLLKTLEPHRQ